MALSQGVGRTSMMTSVSVSTNSRLKFAVNRLQGTGRVPCDEDSVEEISKY